MELRSYFRTSNDHRITRIALGPAVGSIALVYGLLRPRYGLALAAITIQNLRLGSLSLTTLGLLVVVIMLLAPRGFWDLLAERFGITLVPIQRRRIGEPWTHHPPQCPTLSSLRVNAGSEGRNYLNSTLIRSYK